MIEIRNLEVFDSLFNQVIAEIRDVEIQQDRMRFRRNLERIGEIMAYEISKTMEYESKEVVTPLGVKEVRVLKEQPVLATILRAGLPFHQGLLNMFDKADNAFIAAYRKYDKDDDSEIRVEYFSSPDLDGRVLIICDPLLATGESLVKTIDGLLGDFTEPKHIHIAVAVASSDGLEHLRCHMYRHNITIWVGSVDDELTARAYVVPGLGDAGDLAFGAKHG
ncbi:MAG: uracil phosphoribosyltransferase [Bacteroidales bacterium]|nr:uracil phosphoribosyltransferase [Bacteroidales bacterium]